MVRRFHAAMLAVAIAGSAFAAPPAAELSKVEAGAVKAKVVLPAPDGGFADIRESVPPGAAVVWRIQPAPIQRAADLPAGRLIFAGKPGTTYSASAVVVDFEKKTIEEFEYTVTFTGEQLPPPKKKDDPPPPPTDKFYFLIVRPDGPASPAFTQTMSDPAWVTLTAAGHTYKDKTLTQAAALRIVLPAGTVLPVVVTLRVSADGASSELVRGPIPLPTTADAIRRLPEGIAK